MNRNIVITGGTSGIGLALKELFKKCGDNVITFSLEDTKEENHYFGSVNDENKVKQVFDEIHNKFGNIDILINCAGIGMSGITELIPTEQIHKLVEVNYYGTLYCTRSALPFMESGAKIINLSSAMALFPVPFRSIYGSVKSAVLNLSFSLRMELAPLGIDVVAFCPGDTKTNFTKNRIKDFETNERYGNRINDATKRKDANENKKLSCDYVANKIFKYTNKKKTKPFYIIGNKYKFLYFLTRITPKSLLLNQTAKLYGGKTTK
ncbi:MAG: SDR family NAD(P)-dependent oxidoreductase [Christensenellales bacterium]